VEEAEHIPANLRQISFESRKQLILKFFDDVLY
jgi:hypothetical protein